ncbi:uncharacterized protein LOC122945782 isoform X2 [Bufo gargarizans]|nr:uncharacterized protein LOC122945782 isoform X2 [Bufo gargarizans]
MEEHRNDSWVVVAMEPVVLKLLMLDTYLPSILLAPDGHNDASSNYSCSVNNVARTALKVTEWTNMMGSEWIVCHTPENWTLLQFSRGDDMIAMVHKAEAWINVINVDRNGSAFFITSTAEEDDGSSPSFEEPVIKTLNVTCRWWSPPNKAKGWQLFLEGRYWIIVAVASSSALLCLTLMGCFVSVKRRRRVRRQAKSRFFKVSTTTRNLYTDSIDPEADVAYKDQDFTYQNVSLSKVVNDDCFSNKSSFLSVGGDSYLEPMVEGGDQVSDGGCYENTTPDRGDHQGSLDGDCYENASEEIKDGSEGSQSYEDMKGSICLQTETETLPDEGITQDEDADSYENMQTPLYTQLNRIIYPPHKPTEEQAEGRKASLVDPTPHLHPRKESTKLQELNGDFYVSYETNNL